MKISKVVLLILGILVIAAGVYILNFYSGYPGLKYFNLPHHTTLIYGKEIKMLAYLYFPKGKGPFPAVIALPGGPRVKKMGKVGPHDKYFGWQMAERGIASLILDYSNPDRTFLDPLRIQDIGAAVDFLKNQNSIQQQNIFLVGFSMGGANALRLAGSRDDIAGLVCYFTPNDWRIRKKRTPRKIDKQPIDYCANISCPVLILHGDKDIVTEIRQGQHLYKTMKSLDKDVKIIIYKGAGHGFTYRGIRSKRLAYNVEICIRSFNEVNKFIKAHLR